MSENPHFLSAGSWREAAGLVDFEPLRPRPSAGRRAGSFAVFVRDHRLREIARRDRSLEIFFADFSMSQSRRDADEARRLALEVSYGREARDVSIAGRAGRAFELGPPPPPDDIDPRMPAVVAWHDGEMFYLLASDNLEVGELLPIAESCYRRRG